MGGMQALSRSTFSKMVPKTENTTSYFSFYDVSQKVSIVFGMTLFAFIDQVTGSMRNSILFFLIMFLVGALLLKRINTNNIWFCGMNVETYTSSFVRTFIKSISLMY